MQQDPGRCSFLETRHGSCVARRGEGVLLLGGSGSGKSDLALRLLDRGFQLVADDRVMLDGTRASPPPALRGLLEVRGLGILHVAPVFPVPVRLVLLLSDTVHRMPEPRTDPELGIPLLPVSPWHVSAPLLVEAALDCVLGRRTMLEGFLETDPQQTHGRSVTET